MKCVALLLSIAAVALTAPTAADAGQGHGARGGRGGGWRDDVGAASGFVEGRGRGRGRNIPQPQYIPGPRPPQQRPGAMWNQRPGPLRPGQMWRPRQDSLGAGWREQQDEARSGVRQGRFVPLSRVLPQLQRRMPGRQLDAGIEQGFTGQTVYRVRWAAANGRRVDFIVDARTGAVLRAEGQ